MGKTKMKSLSLILACLFLLTGCLSIPTGDGGSISLSSKGVQIESSDGERTDININTKENKVSITGTDGQEKLVIEEKDGEVNYQHTDKDGNVSETKSLFDQLPEGFPKEIPIPEDATELVSIENETDGKKMYMISFEMLDSTVNEYYPMYLDFLQQRGYENIIDSTYGAGDKETHMANLSGESPTEKILISIMVAGTGEFDKGAVRIGITYSEK